MESQKENNLFYVCGLLEQVARKTNNTKRDLFKYITIVDMEHYLDLADVYHCIALSETADEVIARFSISSGQKSVEECNGKIPSVFTMGRVYQRLILSLSNKEQEWLVKMKEVMCSWFADHLDNYDESTYWENISYQVACYESGMILSDD